MNQTDKHQIIISGVGGQGVLFITRLLAEAAIAKGMPVLTSETHGMAQRGGSVVSYLKVGGFSSPLIRPGHGDGLLALKAESIGQYRAHLKPASWVVANSSDVKHDQKDSNLFSMDADRLAIKLDSPKSVNLVVLGYAVARINGRGIPFFCTLKDIEARLEDKLANNRTLLMQSLKALRAGFEHKP